MTLTVLLYRGAPVIYRGPKERAVRSLSGATYSEVVTGDGATLLVRDALLEVRAVPAIPCPTFWSLTAVSKESR